MKQRRGQFAEKDEETGLNSFELRQYDARFGRWLQTDPYGQFASPYVGMGNIPHMGVDPDGGWCCGGQVVGSGPILAGVLLDEVVITASRISAATVASGAMSGLATVSENTNMGGFNINGGGQSTVSYEGFDKPYTQGDGSFVPSEVPDYGIPERVKLRGLGGPSEPSVFSDMMKYVTLDNAQMAIDAAGWVPGVQTVSGIVSAGISVYKGNYGMALLSLASAVPVVGYVAKGGKLAKYSVGAYKRLKGAIKGLDAHHVGQSAVMKKFIPNYNRSTAPAILVPKVGHTIRGLQNPIEIPTKVSQYWDNHIP